MLYTKAGLQLSLSQRPLRSARQTSMDRIVTISVNRNHEAVKVKSQNPPKGGVDSDGIREAIQARGKLQKYHRQSSMPLVS